MISYPGLGGSGWCCEAHLSVDGKMCQNTTSVYNGAIEVTLILSLSCLRAFLKMGMTCEKLAIQFFMHKSEKGWDQGYH